MSGPTASADTCSSYPFPALTASNTAGEPQCPPSDQLSPAEPRRRDERYLFGICRDTSPSPPRGGGKGPWLASPAGTCSCRWARSACGKRRSCGPSAGCASPGASERLRCPAKQGDGDGVMWRLGQEFTVTPSKPRPRLSLGTSRSPWP